MTALPNLLRASYTGMRATPFHRAIRRIIPSTASLTYASLGKAVLYALDLPFRALVKDFRRLPPAHLRLRVGVGDQLVGNQAQFYYASHLWMVAFSKGWASPASNIVDLGSGCGRYAAHLRDLDMMGVTYTGQYTGVDIDKEALNWCRKTFPETQFQWRCSTDGSTTYNQGQSARSYMLPLAATTQDFVFSTSLFTHLLEPELQNYLNETARVLKPGGWMAHSVFCLDYPPPTYGTRHTFRHRQGRSHIESVQSPEAAVAYTAKDLIAMAEQAGLTDISILHGEGMIQPMLLARGQDER